MCNHIRGWNYPVILGVLILLSGCWSEGLSMRSNAPSQSNEPITPPPTKSIAAGRNHFLAIHDGKLYSWGNNFSNKSTPPILPGNPVAISANVNHSAVLTDTGDVVSFGWQKSIVEGQLETPADLTDVIKIVAGKNTNLALTQTGKLVMWGERKDSTTPLVDGEKIVDVDMGYDHFIALLDDGRVVTWGGPSDHNELKIPSKLTDEYRVTQIAAGEFHNLVLREDGKLFAWGENQQGQCDVPEINQPVIAIDATGTTSLALLEDGTLLTWGDPLNATQFPQNIVEIDADYNQVIAKTADGKIHILHSERPINLDSLADIRFTSGSFTVDQQGLLHSVFQDDPLPELINGAPIIKVVGGNQSYEQAFKYHVFTSSPWGGENPVYSAISVGGLFNMALSEVYLLNVWSRFSDPNNIENGLSDYVSVADASCSLYHCLATDIDGRLHAWGSNGDDEFSPTVVPDNLSNIAEVQAESTYNLVLTESGALHAWGESDSPVLNLPTIDEAVTSLETSGPLAAAVTESGQVYVWGAVVATHLNSTDEVAPIAQVAIINSAKLATLSDQGDVLIWTHTEGNWNVTPEPSTVPIIDISYASGVLNMVDELGRVKQQGHFVIPFEISEIVASYN